MESLHRQEGDEYTAQRTRGQSARTEDRAGVRTVKTRILTYALGMKARLIAGG